MLLEIVLTSSVRTGVVAVLVGLSSVAADTVAYWRFENGPANTNVSHSTAAGVFDGTTKDASGNGNHLSVWSAGGSSGYAYRGNVPYALVPQDGGSNLFSVRNTGSFPAFFTSATASPPAGINAETLTPLRFTIEVSYKPQANGGFRTIVCRDARTVSNSDANLAALYLQARPDDSVGIRFTDVSGYTHDAFSPPGWLYGYNPATDAEGTGVPWYNLVAVSDGAVLKFYVDRVLVATTNIAASGSPDRSLAKGTTSGTDWKTGAWAVGRGLYAGVHGDRAFGFIDEARISNSALAPGEFLSVTKPRITGTSVSGSLITIQAAKGVANGINRLLKSPDLSLPMESWIPDGTGTFDAGGNGTFVRSYDPAVRRMFYVVDGVIPVPPAGALTWSLAGDSGSWPADKRAAILYAMNGAAAQYNRYGTFRKHLTAYYNPSVPTAQASYNGRIDFGGQIGYRTALHEISHTLGVGTIQAWRDRVIDRLWTGSNGIAQMKAFVGPNGVVNSDGTHFWDYGLNQETEGNTESFRRHVLMVAAFRRDMGIP